MKRLGRSVSLRRMFRDTEKLPLTMMDKKLINGTSASQKDQGEHAKMKIANFSRVPNRDDELDYFSFKMVTMNVNFS